MIVSNTNAKDAAMAGNEGNPLHTSSSAVPEDAPQESSTSGAKRRRRSKFTDEADLVILCEVAASKARVPLERSRIRPPFSGV